MKITTAIYPVVFLACSAWQVDTSTVLTERDVFVPKIFTPSQGDAWVVGQKYNVTWDTSTAPSQITNTNGRIFLRKGDKTLTNEPLAQDFDILLGHYEVATPAVTPGDDYRVVLFGNSGNWSPQFSIRENSASPKSRFSPEDRDVTRSSDKKPVVNWKVVRQGAAVFLDSISLPRIFADMFRRYMYQQQQRQQQQKMLLNSGSPKDAANHRPFHGVESY